MVKCQGFSFGEVSKSSHHEQAGCDQPVADAVVYFLFVVAGEFRQRLVHKQSVVAQDHQQNLYESISNVGLLEEQESEASRQLYNADWKLDKWRVSCKATEARHEQRLVQKFKVIIQGRFNLPHLMSQNPCLFRVVKQLHDCIHQEEGTQQNYRQRVQACFLHFIYSFLIDNFYQT